MFEAIPEADIYLMKHILYDWNDDECRQILRVARESTQEDGRLLLFEWLVLSSNEPHFAKLLDIHMLCVGSERQRTRAEFGTISADAGWQVAEVLDVPHSPVAMVELEPA
jgi:hypothetical protein